MKKLRAVFDLFPVWVLALALMAGLLYVLPPILLKKAAEREGRFFVLPNLNHLSDDALYYLPQAREIYEGHFPSEVNFVEYKDKTWFILPPLPQVVTAGFIALTRGDISAAVIGLIFAFGTINFLCFYAVGRVMMNSRLWAVWIATAALMTHAALRLPSAFYKKGVAVDLIANMIPSLRLPVGELPLVRVADPLLTLPLYLICFLLLYRFIRQPSVKRASILAASLGVLSYVYLYYWVAILTISGMLFLHEAFRAYRRGSYGELKPWAVGAVVFGFFFLPQIANFSLFNALPGAGDYVLRKGLEGGRHIRFSVYPDYIFYALLGIAAFFLPRRAPPVGGAVGMLSSTVPFRFIAATLAAMFFLWNMQMVTGFNIDPDHWWKTFAPLLLVISVVVAKAVCDRFIFGTRGRKAVSLVLIILIAFMSAKKAINAAAFLRPAPAVTHSYSVPQSIADSWEWMRSHLPPDATVITDSFVSSTYLTIFTSVNPYIAQPINTLAPTASLEKRFVRAHKLFGVSEEQMQAHLADAPWAAPSDACAEPCRVDPDHFRERDEMRAEFNIHGLLYGNAYSPGHTFDQILKGTTSITPSEARQRLREYYAKYQPRQDEFPEHTYLYVGPWERLLWGAHVRVSDESMPVFANESVQIYRIQ